MEKQTLVDLLGDKELIVTFIKKDGTERVMKCTRSASIIPQQASDGKSTQKSNSPDVDSPLISVWDIDAQGFRTINFSTITSVASEDAVIMYQPQTSE